MFKKLTLGFYTVSRFNLSILGGLTVALFLPLKKENSSFLSPVAIHTNPNKQRGSDWLYTEETVELIDNVFYVHQVTNNKHII